MSRRLLDYAREPGNLNLSASILTTNTRMLDLAHWLGFTISDTPDESNLIDAQLEMKCQLNAQLPSSKQTSAMAE